MKYSLALAASGKKCVQILDLHLMKLSSACRANNIVTIVLMGNEDVQLDSPFSAECVNFSRRRVSSPIRAYLMHFLLKPRRLFSCKWTAALLVHTTRFDAVPLDHDEISHSVCQPKILSLRSNFVLFEVAHISLGYFLII